MDPQYYSACNRGLEALVAMSEVGSLNETIQDPDDGSEIEVGGTVIDPTPSIEEQLIMQESLKETSKSLREFVLSLSPYMQCIVFRRFWLNHSPQKIADDLGRKRPAIYNALSRVPALGQKYFSETATV